MFAIGVLLNKIVVYANGMRMPVALSSWDIDARLVKNDGFYIPMGKDTKLNLLGDWLSTPWWFLGIASPGDIIILVGSVILLFEALLK